MRCHHSPPESMTVHHCLNAGTLAKHLYLISVYVMLPVSLRSDQHPPSRAKFARWDVVSHIADVPASSRRRACTIVSRIQKGSTQVSTAAAYERHDARSRWVWFEDRVPKKMRYEIGVISREVRRFWV